MVFLGDKSPYLSSSVSATEGGIKKHEAKVWVAMDSLSIIRKPDLSDRIKRDFF